jgi:arylsulfatase A-like enzyme
MWFSSSPTNSKIPLIFNWKNHLSPAVRSQLISHVDVAPTILDLCNIKIPPAIQGQSARNLLKGDVRNVRDFLVIQNQPLDPWSYPRISPQKLMAYLSSDRLLMYERCIVTDDWKLILNSNPERAPELYRRKTDLDESDNRYSDPSSRDVRDRLLRTLEQYGWTFQDQLALILPR